MFQCCKRDFLILHEPVDKFLSIENFLYNFRLRTKMYCLLDRDENADHPSNICQMTNIGWIVYIIKFEIKNIQYLSRNNNYASSNSFRLHF